MADNIIVPSAVLLFTLLLILLGYHRRRSNRHNFPPSGPGALPIIGHLHHVPLSLPVHQTLAGLSDRYGPVLLLRCGSRPVLVISCPSAAEECLTKNDAAFANRPQGLLVWEHLSYNYTSLIAAPYGPHFRKLRHFSTMEVFSAAKTASTSSLRAGEVQELLRQLFRSSSASVEEFHQVNVHVKLLELTMNMMMQTIAGKRYHGESGTEGQEEKDRFLSIVDEVNYMLGKSNLEDFLPLLKWLGIGSTKKSLAKLEKKVDELFQDIINDRRSRNPDKAKEGEEKKTILDILLSLQEEDPEYYTDVLIKGLIQVIIFAGIDTSSNTMEWALSLLLKHPEIQDKLRAEIDAQVGHERLLMESDLANLPYLDNVVKETLRLFPSGPLLVPHETSADCTVANYDIPHGTMLLVNAYAIQRDPKLWDNPLEFKPERFDGNEEGKGFNYLPFGFGRRKCPGKLIANRTVGLVLGTFVQCFEWKRVGEEEVDLTEGVGLNLPRAVPLEAMYKPRQAMGNMLSQL